jgi:hypothetical protein
MRTFEIYNYIYENVCDDSWYGKESKEFTIGFVMDTEENVKSLVDEINEKRGSVYSHEPESEWDDDCDNENYIAYREVMIDTFDGIRDSHRCRPSRSYRRANCN